MLLLRQARLKEKDPIKAKTKARYVIGLKQVGTPQQVPCSLPFRVCLCVCVVSVYMSACVSAWVCTCIALMTSPSGIDIFMSSAVNSVYCDTTGDQWGESRAG